MYYMRAGNFIKLIHPLVAPPGIKNSTQLYPHRSTHCSLHWSCVISFQCAIYLLRVSRLNIFYKMLKLYLLIYLFLLVLEYTSKNYVILHIADRYLTFVFSFWFWENWKTTFFTYVRCVDIFIASCLARY